MEATTDRRAYARAERTGRAVYLRHERKEGWRGALPIYVLWCDACRVFTETHPAGYAGKVHCRKCRRWDRPWTRQRFREEAPAMILPAAVIAAILALGLLLLRRLI